MTESPPTPPPFGAKQPHRADLEHARQRRRGRGWRIAAVVVLAVALAATLTGVWGYRTYLSDLPTAPTQQALWSLNRAPGMTFEDHEGHVIATRGPKHGYKVALKDLPAYVPRAFLAAEDRRFYQHGPVDFRGIARALKANLKAGQVVQGGSTLTQQLAKTLFLTPDQTLKRKVQEAAIAYRMERAMSKDEVLELYLNRVFFGANAYGVDAASQTYFGKPAKALSISEAALLAALPKAPTRLALTNDFPAALARSKTVLAAMREEGWITPAQEAAALADTPKLAPEAPGEGDYGYVLDMAAAQAVALAGDKAPDLVVRISIEPALQTTAQAIVRRAIAEEGRLRRGATQGALVALAPDGAIRALVGGVDHRESPFNRAVQAQRQPGSSFKPLVYATALENGVRPADERADKPFKLGTWSPENYGGGYHGMVTVETALIHSYNTVSVRLADEVGPGKVGELARRFGVASIPQNPQLSIALGAYEVNLLELTGAYQVFQQGGSRQTPYLIESITTSRGDALYARPSGTTAIPVYDGVHAAEMVKMMRGVIERGTGTRANIGRPAAGKTGTSQSWRDAWFVGFTPDWVCGVWVGNDESRPMRGMKGGDLPAEIWKRFMLVAHNGLPVRDFPLTPGLDDLQTAQAEPAQDKAVFYDTLSSEFARAADEAEDEMSGSRDEGASFETPAAPAPQDDEQ